MHTMQTFHFKIASPERVVFEEEVFSVSLPTEIGEITILPHHIPLIINVVAGEIVARNNSQIFSLAVSGGFLEITPNEVTLLADTAERAEEIDEARAEEARKRAQQLLTEKNKDAVEYATLAAKIQKELARLRVARKRKR